MARTPNPDGLRAKETRIRQYIKWLMEPENFAVSEYSGLSKFDLSPSTMKALEMVGPDLHKAWRLAIAKRRCSIQGELIEAARAKLLDLITGATETTKTVEMSTGVERITITTKAPNAKAVLQVLEMLDEQTLKPETPTYGNL